MAYLEISIPVPQELTEIIIAELSYLPFNSFEEKENELVAYILEEDYQGNEVKEILANYNISVELTPVKMENKNWNEEWEKNFDPIVVSDKCCVRATFHEPKNVPYEVIINPRMAFGTGHHATTQLMMLTQFNVDFKGKKVIDAGAGTAVLSILAEKLGAKSVIANDIDDWAYENAIENCKLNDCQNIEVKLGAAAEVYQKDLTVDIVLANINKNVLLDEIPMYTKLLSNGGNLLLSGFYENDMEDINANASKFGFKQISFLSKNDWACILFEK